jgi:dihydroflavonol-4-reductase
MTKIFLTGATGFLGGHLLTELKAAGGEVWALSRRPETDEAILARGATPVRGSLSDEKKLHAAVRGCAAIFHVAGDTSMWRRNAAVQTATNVLGTANLLQAAERAGVPAFIHTSSVAAYSHLVSGVIDESVPQLGAQSWINYERTKYQSEVLVRNSRLPWTIFQPSHILGPGDRHNWARLIMLVDREKLPGIPPGIGSFADVREIAKAQVRAWQRQRIGETYLVGGEQASFADLVHRVGAALGKRTPQKAMPVWALMTVARLANAWSRFTGKEPDMTPEAAALTCHVLRVNSSKAKRELDYLETPLDALLADTLSWMRQEGMLGKSEVASDREA